MMDAFAHRKIKFERFKICPNSKFREVLGIVKKELVSYSNPTCISFLLDRRNSSSIVCHTAKQPRL